MKTNEIRTEIENAINNDLDAFIIAVRKSDGYEMPIADINGELSNIDRVINNANEKIEELVNLYNWEIERLFVEED